MAKLAVYLKVEVETRDEMPRARVERELREELRGMAVYGGLGCFEVRRVKRLPKADVIDIYEAGTHECPHPYH